MDWKYEETVIALSVAVEINTKTVSFDFNFLSFVFRLVLLSAGYCRDDLKIFVFASATCSHVQKYILLLLSEINRLFDFSHLCACGLDIDSDST